MNLKLFVIVMFSAMLITIGVGNMLTAPAASPCNNGQCNIPQETAAIPPLWLAGNRRSDTLAIELYHRESFFILTEEDT